MPTTIDLGSSPTPPYVYTFTVTDNDSLIWEEKSCFVGWATSLKPSGNITTTLPTFSWTGINDDGASYLVQLKDSSNNLIWESVKWPGTSYTYNGATRFTSGSTYQFYVLVIGTSACSGGRSIPAPASFTYTGP